MNNNSKIGIALGVAAAGVLVWRLSRKSATTTTTTTTTTSAAPNSTMTTRGYRNNNPLNIRIGNSAWQGKITPNTDGEFEQFTTMAYGYRAAMVLLRNYIKAGYNTIEKIINRWAPTNENNTSGYITRVCNTTGYSASTVISATSKEQFCKLVYAMSLVENGKAYDGIWDDINKGWELYI